MCQIRAGNFVLFSFYENRGHQTQMTDVETSFAVFRYREESHLIHFIYIPRGDIARYRHLLRFIAPAPYAFLNYFISLILLAF